MLTNLCCCQIEDLPGDHIADSTKVASSPFPYRKAQQREYSAWVAKDHATSATTPPSSFSLLSRTRPLLHLERDGQGAMDPEVYLLSAFLDTRLLQFQSRAVLRLVGLVRRDVEEAYYCKYVTQSRYYYSLSTR